MPLITTFIPTYRRPHQLKEAIESVLSQTVSDFQVVILDNHSEDETGDMVKSLQAKDQRIRYHCHEKNLGMLGNYAYAFQHIETPFFHLISDDDHLLPHFYETALKQLQEHPECAYCACGVHAVTPEGQVLADPLACWSRDGVFDAPSGALEMVKRDGRFPIPHGTLFRTSLALQVSPRLTESIQLMWDPDYLLRLAGRFPIAVDKTACARFVVNDGGYSSAYYANLRQSSQEVGRLINAYALIYSASHSQKKLARGVVWTLQCLIVRLGITYLSDNKGKEILKLRKTLNNSFARGGGAYVGLTFLYACTKSLPLYRMARAFWRGIKRFL